MPRVHLVDQPLRVLDERAAPPVAAAVVLPVAGVQVLDQEHTAIDDIRPQLLEGRDLLTHRVATVLDEYVDGPDPLGQLTQKPAIFLIADLDLDLLAAQLCGPR